MNLPNGKAGFHLGQNGKFNFRRLHVGSTSPENLFNKCGQIWQVRHIAKVWKPPTNNTIKLCLCFHLDFREAHHSEKKGMNCRNSRVCPTCVALMDLVVRRRVRINFKLKVYLRIHCLRLLLLPLVQDDWYHHFHQRLPEPLI